MGKLQKDFGKRLRQLRKARKLTQEQIAAKVNMDWKYYGMIERGELNSTLETIDRLAIAFNIEVYQLFIFTFEGLIEDLKILEDSKILEDEFYTLLSMADNKVKKKILKIGQLILSG